MYDVDQEEKQKQTYINNKYWMYEEKVRIIFVYKYKIQTSQSQKMEIYYS